MTWEHCVKNTATFVAVASLFSPEARGQSTVPPHSASDKLRVAQEHYQHVLKIEADTINKATDWTQLAPTVANLQSVLLEVIPDADLSTKVDDQPVPWLADQPAFSWTARQSKLERPIWFGHLTGRTDQPVLLSNEATSVKDAVTADKTSPFLDAAQVTNLLGKTADNNSKSDVFSAIIADTPPRWSETNVGRMLHLSKTFRAYADDVQRAAFNQANVIASVPPPLTPGAPPKPSTPAPSTPLLLPPISPLAAPEPQAEPFISIVKTWNLYLQQFNTIAPGEKWSVRLTTARAHLNTLLTAAKPLTFSSEAKSVQAVQAELASVVNVSLPQFEDTLAQAYALEVLSDVTKKEGLALLNALAVFQGSFGKFAAGMETDNIETTLNTQWAAVTACLTRIARLELICTGISADFTQRLVLYRDLAAANTSQIVDWTRSVIRNRAATGIRKWQIAKGYSVEDTVPVVSNNTSEVQLRTVMDSVVISDSSMLDNFIISELPTEFAELTAADVVSYLKARPAAPKDKPIVIMVSRATLKGRWDVTGTLTESDKGITLPSVVIIGVDIRMDRSAEFHVAPSGKVLIWCESFANTPELNITRTPVRIGLTQAGSGHFNVLAKDCASVRAVLVRQKPHINFVQGTRNVLIATWGNDIYNKFYSRLAAASNAEIERLENSPDERDQANLRQMALIFHKVNPTAGMDTEISRLRQKCVGILNTPSVLSIDTPLLDNVFGLRVSEATAGHRFVALPRYFQFTSTSAAGSGSKIGQFVGSGTGFKFRSFPISLMTGGLGRASVKTAIQWNKAFGIDETKQHGISWRAKIDPDRFREMKERLATEGIELQYNSEGGEASSFTVAIAGDFLKVNEKLNSLWTSSERFTVPVKIEMLRKQDPSVTPSWAEVDNGVYLVPFSFRYVLPSEMDSTGLELGTGALGTEPGSQIYYRPRPRDVYDTLAHESTAEVRPFELDLRHLLSDQARFPSATVDVPGESLDYKETKIWMERSSDTKDWFPTDFVFPKSTLRELRLSGDRSMTWKFPFHQMIRIVLELAGSAGQKRQLILQFDDNGRCQPKNLPELIRKQTTL